MQPEKMRILFWSDKFQHPEGGAEMWAARYVPAMHDRGYRIEVIVADEAGPTNADTENTGSVPVHLLPFGNALRNNDPRAITNCLRKVAAIESGFKPHLQHISLGQSAPTLSLFLMSRGLLQNSMAATQTGPVMLTSLHHEWHGELTSADSPYQRLLRQMDWVCCFSQSTLHLLHAQSAAMGTPLVQQSSVITHAIPNSSESYAGRDVMPEQPQTISFIGRLSKEKGADLALKAFAQLRQAFPKSRMVIAGDGPEHAALVALAQELVIAEAVTFTGWLSPEAVQTTLRNSSLLLIPSRDESFGLIALEAAQVGCPVVAANVGGLPEICIHGETGLLCPPEDPPALAAAAATLLADPPLAQRLALAARNRLDALPDWEQHTDAYASLIHRLIMGRFPSLSGTEILTAPPVSQ